MSTSHNRHNTQSTWSPNVDAFLEIFPCPDRRNKRPDWPMQLTPDGSGSSILFFWTEPALSMSNGAGFVVNKNPRNRWNPRFFCLLPFYFCLFTSFRPSSFFLSSLKSVVSTLWFFPFGFAQSLPHSASLRAGSELVERGRLWNPRFQLSVY